MEVELESYMEYKFLSVEEILPSFAPLKVLYLTRTFLLDTLRMLQAE